MMVSIWLMTYGVAAAVGALGIRLLVLAGRTRKLPELLIGLFFLASAPLGFVPLLVGMQYPDLPRELAGLLLAVGEGMVALASALICVFTWRVFRPDSIWAKWLAGLCVTVLIGGYGVHAWTRGFTEPGISVWLWASVFVRLVIYAWNAAEPLLHYRGARRRLLLGLADPVVTNRFLLWSIWGGACLIVVFARIGDMLAQSFLAPMPAVSLASVAIFGCCGAACGAAIWLTFFPPAAYRKWLTARAARRT